VLIRLLGKDLSLIVRNLKTLLSLFFFSLLLAFVFSFSFLSLGLTNIGQSQLFPAILVVTILFVSCLLFSQTVLAEREEGALLSLIYSGYSGVQLFASKLITNYLILIAILISFLFELQLFYAELPSFATARLLLVILPFGLAIGALGTMLSLIAAVSSNREVLFSILFFPLSLPAVGAALELFKVAVSGQELELGSFAMIVLLVSALIYTTLGAILFDEAV
jgi:ABC-type transport system involved in cytochrome c biogenesis permease component